MEPFDVKNNVDHKSYVHCLRYSKIVAKHQINYERDREHVLQSVMKFYIGDQIWQYDLIKKTKRVDNQGKLIMNGKLDWGFGINEIFESVFIACQILSVLENSKTEEEWSRVSSDDMSSLLSLPPLNSSLYQNGTFRGLVSLKDHSPEDFKKSCLRKAMKYSWMNAGLAFGNSSYHKFSWYAMFDS